MSAAEMTAILGVEPDEVRVRGSRISGPKPVPGAHIWKVVCRDPGLAVERQIARVVGRLAPHADAIGALVGRIDGEWQPSAVLEVVRFFGHPDGQEGRADAHPDLTDSPDLLGWYLDRDVLQFLHTTGAVLDVDEYDYTAEPEDD